MKNKYESISIFEFQQLFPTNEECLIYLDKMRWENGFVCPSCSHKHFCRGKNPYDKQCTRCRRNTSPTSGTVFHNIKFPILKAFYIVYYLSTSKKGMASTELSRKLNLRQPTAWAFKHKVMQGMKSSGKSPLSGIVLIANVKIQSLKSTPEMAKKRQPATFAIELMKNGVARAFGQVRESGESGCNNFLKDRVNPKARIYITNISQKKSLLRKFPEAIPIIDSSMKKQRFLMERFVDSFQSWLKGVHHHVTYLQAYVDEYVFRYNRHFMKKDIFNCLLYRLLTTERPTKLRIIS